MFKFLARCQTTSSISDKRLESVAGAGCKFAFLEVGSVCGRKCRTIVGLSLQLYLKKLTKVYLLAYTPAWVRLPLVSADVFF